ncbi:hypothetical protein [Hoeflea marina]|uniref:hypothetical protein n=1 Tax=Hoeflea marina TaxID=274592 RepID=UPI000D71A0EB|nr:hypothetical protein [Hoeflea marina]
MRNYLNLLRYRENSEAGPHNFGDGLDGSATCADGSRPGQDLPSLVVLFGIIVVPLALVSVTLIIIKQILLGTWCSLCPPAAAMPNRGCPFDR